MATFNPNVFNPNVFNAGAAAGAGGGGGSFYYYRKKRKVVPPLNLQLDDSVWKVKPKLENVLTVDERVKRFLRRSRSTLEHCDS